MRRVDVIHACGLLVAALVAGAGCARPRDAHVGAARQPLAGAEFALDATERWGPSAGGASIPALATDGSGYLAVWCAGNLDDNRRRAARLGSDGALLDDPPADLGRCWDANYRGRAAIVHTSQGYVVAFQKYATSYDLESMLFKPDGTRVDNGIVASAPKYSRAAPALATDGSSMLLVWADDRVTPGQYAVYARRLDLGGAPLGSEVQLAPPGGDRVPAVAFDGTSYLVAWDDGLDIRAVHVDTTGNVVETTPLVLASEPVDIPTRPALASNGTGLLFAYLAANSALTAHLLASDGSAASTTVQLTSGGSAAPALASDGDGFLAAWHQTLWGVDGDLHAARFSGAGALLDPSPALSLAPDPGGDVALVGNANGYLAGWAGPTAGVPARQVFVATVSSAGVVGAPTLLTRGVDRQTMPAAAFDGTRHLVAWADYGNAGYDMRGTRVTPAGTVVDQPSLVLAGAGGDQTNVALAFGKDASLMTWTEPLPPDAGRVVAARVGTDGQVGAGHPIADALIYTPSALAFDGNDFLVAWDGDGVQTRRVDLDGTPLAAATTVWHQDGTSPSRPAVAWGGYYLVGWSDDDGTKVARLAADGALLDPVPVVVATPAEVNAFSNLGPPAIAFGGGVFLVVFLETLGPTYAKRVGLDGTVLDAKPIVLPNAGDNIHEPAVRFDGTDFVVAYGTATGTGDIEVARVTPDGSVVGHDEFSAPAAADIRHTLELSTECGGSTLVVYSRAQATAAGEPNERVFGRMITPDGPVGSPDCSMPAPLEATDGGAGSAGADAGQGGATSGSSGSAGVGAGGASGAAGSAAAGAPSAPAASSSDQSGCGCRTSRGAPSSAWALAVVALAFAQVRRRRQPDHD